MPELSPDPQGPSGQFENVSRRQDYDGKWITIKRARSTNAALGATAADATETVVDGVWTFYEDEPISDLLVWKLTNTRTVPGEWVYGTREDLLLGPVQTKRRLVENTGQAAANPLPSLTEKTTYEKRENSRKVFYEVVETMSTGAGATGNPLYPVVPAPIAFDLKRGSVGGYSQLVRFTQKVIAATIVNGGTAGLDGEETVTGTTGTGTKFQILTTIAGGTITALGSITVPGAYSIRPTNLAAEPVSGNITGATLALTMGATETATLTVNGGIATLIQYEPFDEFRLKKIVETFAAPGVPLPEVKDNGDGTTTTTVRTLKLNSAITEGETLTAGNTLWNVTTSESYSETLSWEVVATRPIPGGAITTTKPDEDGVTVTLSKQLVKLADIVTSEAVVSTNLVRKWKGEGTSLVADQMIETRAATGTSLPGLVMSGEAQAALAVTSSQSLPASDAAYAPTWKTLSYSDRPIDSQRKQRDIATLPDAAFPILTEHDQDEETGANITTTYQVVEAATVSAPSFTVGQITRYRRIDKWRSLKIFTVFATPSSYSEFRFAAHHFPSLLYDYTYTDACGAYVVIREGFSAFTDCRVDISFGSYDASITGLLIKPNSFRISKFVVNDVLNDSDTLVITGDCSDSLVIPASTPTRTAYEALIGSFSLISGESVLWKAGRFRTTRLYYRML